MRRGEIWTAAASAGYVGKPVPVAIVLDNHFDATDSVVRLGRAIMVFFGLAG